MTSRPRIVPDTNVFVAAGFNPRSSSAEIIRGIERGRFELVWHQATRRETERILRQIPRLSQAMRAYSAESAGVPASPSRSSAIAEWAYAPPARISAATQMASMISSGVAPSLVAAFV